MSEQLLSGYCIRRGSTLDRALLVKFMQRTYEEMFPQLDFSHLALTVEQYLSDETPLWWVEEDTGTRGHGDTGTNNFSASSTLGVAASSSFSASPRLPLSASSLFSPSSPVGCLWVGNAIDQVRGSRYANIFLLYVVPEHRRRGVGTALMQYVQAWAFNRGDRQIGLQVFESNTPALNLYNQLGYQTQSLWMIKSLESEKY